MKKNLTFRDAMKRLDEITLRLEHNDIALEEAILLFEEGLKLVQQCDAQLKGFENKVESLMDQYKEGEES